MAPQAASRGRPGLVRSQAAGGGDKTGEVGRLGLLASMFANRSGYQGSEKVLTVVMTLIASITPSLTPRPESFTPPKGELSMR